MGIGITAEHEELRAAARDVLKGLCPREVPRAALEAAEERIPALWTQLAALGWAGLAVAGEHGGGDRGLPELVVVLEELGRACAPGPFLPTVLAAQVVQRHGSIAQCAAWLPGLVDGSATAAVALGAVPAVLAASADGSLEITGELEPVLGGATAALLLVPVAGGRVAVVDPAAPGVTVQPVRSLDPTRRLARVRLESVRVPAARVIDVQPDRLGETEPPRVRALAVVLAAAEACGVAGWCLETTAAYAGVREQFGRPIGSFQAVKHRLADVLVVLEQARSATWDAAAALQAGDDDDDDDAALAVAVAGAVAFDAAVEAAEACIQLHGGIGFTWEHDAHLYLRRALALRALVGPTAHWRAETLRLARAGTRRRRGVDLPPEAEAVRAAVRDELAGYAALPDDTARAEWLVAGGWLAPHWPPPWGRDASPAEQLVIDEELRRARIRRPHLQIGAWALPTLITHGSAEQRERFVGPTLRGQVHWCQMFSEPGAGSDLASLATRAVRDDAHGGWRVTGQKVWTSLATQATHAMLLARTAPPGVKDRRSGISYFVLDMTTPGIDIRPLRELTGAAMFNEVFLDDVFVPDSDLVGEPGDGWRLARTTLANERVAMGSGASFGSGVEGLLGQPADWEDARLVDEVGALVAEAQTIALLGERMTLRALTGASPGSEASVRKLLGAEHEQRVQSCGVAQLGSAAGVLEGPAAHWVGAYLATRCMTIAGGTSEVQRNVIAERLLGLPRDP